MLGAAPLTRTHSRCRAPRSAPSSDSCSIDYRFSRTTRALLLSEHWEEDDRRRRVHGSTRPPIDGPVVLAIAGAERSTIDRGRFRFEGAHAHDFRFVVTHGLIARFSSEALARSYATRFGGFAYVAPASELGTGDLGFEDVTEPDEPRA